MKQRRIGIVGGGAAGFFAAIAAAEAVPGARVAILEKSGQVLQKVRISGGGRCNVTHACFDPREFARRYPRGERELIGPFHRFQARDTVNWFEGRGVRLKTEEDGRMFPVTDSSETIVQCLQNAAAKAGVEVRTNTTVERATKTAEGFDLQLPSGVEHFDALLLGSGGCRTIGQGALASALGHTIEPPVPSLFTFHIEVPWVRELAGLAVPAVEAEVPGTKLSERGPLLFTHWGASGPVILRLSAWGARILHDRGYRFPLRVNWLPGTSRDEARIQLQEHLKRTGARLITNAPFAGRPSRLWEKLVLLSGAEGMRGSNASRAVIDQLSASLVATELPVTGKSLNKDEFVTCGGVRLSEVNFKTMESKLVPGLFFAGEVLDIDGITGGFNFQAAWTTGWIAGHAMAGEEMR